MVFRFLVAEESYEKIARMSIRDPETIGTLAGL
jgi:hypothetical protein